MTVDVSGQVLARGTFLVDLGGGGVALAGDYNGNGLVEQADLDLVLGSWGEGAAAVGEDWVNDPPEGIVDQGELDVVLANWGKTTRDGPSLAIAVPEQSALALLLTGAAWITTIRVSRRARRCGRSLAR